LFYPLLPSDGNSVCMSQSPTSEVISHNLPNSVYLLSSFVVWCFSPNILDHAGGQHHYNTSQNMAAYQRKKEHRAVQGGDTPNKVTGPRVLRGPVRALGGLGRVLRAQKKREKKKENKKEKRKEKGKEEGKQERKESSQVSS
jgi:hypothetical protein